MARLGQIAWDRHDACRGRYHQTVGLVAQDDALAGEHDPDDRKDEHEANEPRGKP